MTVLNSKLACVQGVLVFAVHNIIILGRCAHGHGAVVYPPPRNAIDANDTLPWSGPIPKRPPGVESATGWCPVYSEKEKKVTGQNGQSCFWFSNGCALGCTRCDGTSRGPLPGRNGSTWRGCSKQDASGQWLAKCNLCPEANATATICDSKLRTINSHAQCGGPTDIFYYSPWRAPGSAPVFDSCGRAGGHKPPALSGKASFGGVYINTTHANLGDDGSRTLPSAPSGTVWTPGMAYEVSWAVQANHGGGYQYRLALADGPLTEAEFKKTPLRFVGLQGFRWGGGPKRPGGSELFFNGTYVSEGTVPAGSTWAQNPIPRESGFAPHCPDPAMCAGNRPAASGELLIVDRVEIPAGLAAGEYVLGWRWDCEESNQIWQSCSDVTISHSL